MAIGPEFKRIFATPHGAAETEPVNGETFPITSEETLEHDAEEAAWICDAAFQMASEGIKVGHKICSTWVELVTAQVRS